MGIPYLALLLALACERLLELRVSRAHTAWARARGGIEFGRRHFRVMQLLHAAFFAACAAEVILLRRPFLPALALPMLGLALMAQVLRWWAVLSLGPHWNVRVLVVPGAPAVVRGPYRFLRHPNYLAVVIEGFAVPLVHAAWLTAVGFSVANALLLAVRIRCEERALALHCQYEARLGALPRLLPGPAAAEGR